MRHACQDYNRIQDPDHKIPEHEPVFLLRGQDKHAATTLRFYANQVELNGGDPEVVAMTRAWADKMDAWPVKKSPDTIKIQD